MINTNMGRAFSKKSLIIGDPHIQINKLDVGEEFLRKTSEVIFKNNIQHVIVLGDLFHTFSVVRTEVLSLWTKFFTDHSQVAFVLLVGNHDYAGQDGGTHALEPFSYFDNVTVVDRPLGDCGVLYMPFYRNNKEFAEALKDRPEKTLVCHQSFNGAQFQNGFYDPHGVDPESVSQFHAVISGHIHKYQEFANIWYPGTPYQHNFGEAGEDKYIFEIEFENFGAEGYSVVAQHNLGLPRYNLLKGDSLESLRTIIKNTPKRERDRYKLVGIGSPAEIAAFWADPEVVSFRSKVKQVVDSIVPEKGRIFIDEVQSKSPKERLDAFITHKTWRTDGHRVLAAARTILSQ